ncbi:hypothetical protein CMI42_01050 [Candidatus Pacearchaeota archaeon]|nr:hypothetical protein [Candidatus Pacearchaeota archaeon]|tara:strand:- start:350 stop:625 length:276 start_codon:yes stop_codon:yes gene_type:complete
MNLFDNDYYGLIVSISITLVSLLIVFNLMGIVHDSGVGIKFTGLAVEEVDEIENSYSNKSYFVYLIVFILLVSVIFLVATRLVIPRIKDYT